MCQKDVKFSGPLICGGTRPSVAATTRPASHFAATPLTREADRARRYPGAYRWLQAHPQLRRLARTGPEQSPRTDGRLRLAVGICLPRRGVSPVPSRCSGPLTRIGSLAINPGSWDRKSWPRGGPPGDDEDAEGRRSVLRWRLLSACRGLCRPAYTVVLLATAASDFLLSRRRGDRWRH